MYGIEICYKYSTMIVGKRCRQIAREKIIFETDVFDDEELCTDFMTFPWPFMY